MHEHALDAALLCHAQKRVEMFLRRMDLPVRNQAHKVKLFSAGPGAVHRFGQYFVSEELARLNVMIDYRNIHANHSARSKIEMSDFGIAHHTIGKTDARAVRGEQSLGIFLAEFVVEGLRRHCDRVAFAAW
jgi:hypothetical protein